MGADAAAFSALSERVAELERRVEHEGDRSGIDVAALTFRLDRLEEEVFGRDVHAEVLGEVKPPEPRLDQPKRTR